MTPPHLTRLLRARLRPYRRPVAIIIVLQLAQTLANLYLPSLNADIIDDGVLTGDTGYILSAGGQMLAITLAQIACAAGAVFLSARTAMAVGRDVRGAVFRQVQSFSVREVGQFGAPSLLTRSTNDVQQVQMLVLLVFTLLVSAPFMCVGSIVLALGEDVPLSALLLVMVPVLAVVLVRVSRALGPVFRSMQGRIDRVNRVLREQISGARVVRAFVRDRHEQERFDAANADLKDTAVRVGRIVAWMFPLVTLIMNVTGVGILWFGGHRIDSGGMQVGAVTAFLNYVMQIFMSVMMSTFVFFQVPRAEVCAERIDEILATEPSVAPPLAPVARLRRSGLLELRGVEFRFPGAEEPVLRDIDMTARPG
ncbi:ABC transporter permease, partial [Streptomyces sp. NPDC050610]|uniref:ABC transporter permease n=1 Tax=Streptomyces sp. NPDC050610 TaxID=3157097 RepID=UPI0034337763